MKENEIIGVNLLKNLIDVLRVRRCVTERCDINGKWFTWKGGMNWSKFIKLLRFFNWKLLDLDHVTKLLITNESSVNFDDLLFENEVFLIIHDLQHVCSDERFPDPFIKVKLYSFSCKLIETFKISSININSLTCNTSKAQIMLNLTWYMLSISNFFRFLFPLS